MTGVWFYKRLPEVGEIVETEVYVAYGATWPKWLVVEGLIVADPSMFEEASRVEVDENGQSVGVRYLRRIA